tara:strand:- start:1597 stop:2103 length:507 start_codon:yes stop_codon:yes gene_type:complete
MASEFIVHTVGALPLRLSKENSEVVAESTWYRDIVNFVRGNVKAHVAPLPSQCTQASIVELLLSEIGSGFDYEDVIHLAHTVPMDGDVDTDHPSGMCVEACRDNDYRGFAGTLPEWIKLSMVEVMADAMRAVEKYNEEDWYIESVHLSLDALCMVVIFKMTSKTKTDN